MISLTVNWPGALVASQFLEDKLTPFVKDVILQASSSQYEKLFHRVEVGPYNRAASATVHVRRPFSRSFTLTEIPEGSERIVVCRDAFQHGVHLYSMAYDPSYNMDRQIAILSIFSQIREGLRDQVNQTLGGQE